MHPAMSAENSETATLEEVVFTAQKRTENLQDVAISIRQSARRSSKSCASRTST
jgi:hypothetical protein